MNFRGSKSRSSVTAQSVVQSIAIFNPTDPEYQNDPDFPPDKIDEWDETVPNHMQDNTWCYYNNALLGEISDIISALRSVQSRELLLPSIKKSIQIVLDFHHDWVSQRHQNIKNYHMPHFMSRIKYPQYLLDSMEKLTLHLLEIHELVRSFKTFSDIPELLIAMQSYENDVITFIILGENVGLTLQRYYFSVEETTTVVKFNAASDHKDGGGSILYYNGVEKVRENLVTKSHFAQEEDLQAIYEKYLADFVEHVDAIISGVPLHPADAPLLTHTGKSARDLKIDKRTSRRLSNHFNPVDPVYQKDPNFPPDNLPKWEDITDCANSFWNLVQEAIKHEIRSMKHALSEVQTRGKVSKWELDFIRECFILHRETVSGVLRIHKSDLLRLMEERCNTPEAVDRMHVGYPYALHSMYEVLMSIKPGDKIDRFSEKWSTYTEDYIAFCDLQEVMMSSLFRAYYSPEEANDERLAPRRILKKFPKSAIGCFVAHVGKEHFRKTIMVTEKISVMDWRFDYGPKHAAYAQGFLAGLKALQKGTPPGQSSFSNIFSQFYTGLDLEEEEL
mmetsp:Transcript_9949/g.15338  ORF Transcript_9949/g.15338 Transcript_9949/m.15338 type:complete len:560 (-) Transcript_9949:202-1881(-)